LQNNTFSTLFVGQNLIKLLEVDSTNSYLKNLASKSEPLPEGTVIMAENQFAGRGQQENIWHTEAGKNLTFSLLLKPNFLALNEQFYLNIAVSLAIYKAISKYLSNDLAIKWPNDIYYRDKKLGGILIENTIVGNGIKSAVVGIGLNINQQSFSPAIAEKAISICQILQQDVNLENLLADICSCLESSYLQLKARNYTLLKQAYVDKLYKLKEKAFFRHNGEDFEGIIKGVTENGLLEIQKGTKIMTFNFKEIEFLNHMNMKEG
jgi:BirA family biotin operon repressor/biotin-[acetyl-CoA-carboxylase] ligase